MKGRAYYLFCILLVLCAPLALAAETSEDYSVSIQRDSYRFDPPRIIIEVGDTVNWINEDQRKHLTASIPDGTGELEIFCPDLFPGNICSHTFSLPGRYPYFCFIHSNMVGEVIVVQ